MRIESILWGVRRGRRAATRSARIPPPPLPASLIPLLDRNRSLAHLAQHLDHRVDAPANDPQQQVGGGHNHVTPELGPLLQFLDNGDDQGGGGVGPDRLGSHGGKSLDQRGLVLRVPMPASDDQRDDGKPDLAVEDDRPHPLKANHLDGILKPLRSLKSAAVSWIGSHNVGQVGEGKDGEGGLDQVNELEGDQGAKDGRVCLKGLGRVGNDLGGKLLRPHLKM